MTDAAIDLALAVLRLDEYLRQSGDDKSTPEFKELGEEDNLSVFREAYLAECREWA